MSTTTTDKPPTTEEMDALAQIVARGLRVYVVHNEPELAVNGEGNGNVHGVYLSYDSALASRADHYYEGATIDTWELEP
jgi:hypothetical protein